MLPIVNETMFPITPVQSMIHIPVLKVIGLGGGGSNAAEQQRGADRHLQSEI